MKKNLLNIAFLLITALAFTACNSSDDIADNGGNGGSVIDNSNIVKNDAQAQALVNGSYGPLQRLSSSFSFVIETQSNKIISFEGEDDKEGPLNSRFLQQPDTWYQIKIFNNLYLSIANDNNAIRLIKDNANVSDAAKNSAIGKAKLLRGLSYLYLVQLWGEVPIRTENDSTNLSRNSIDEVYNQIIADLTDAENLLPEIDAKRSEIGFCYRSEKLPDRCRQCRWLTVCRGGCYRQRMSGCQGEANLNYFCEAYQMFFETCWERLNRAAEITRERMERAD